METTGGWMNLWQQGDAVTRFVALLLLAMSLASWVVMILKALDQARLRRQAQRVEAFWESADYDAGLQALGTVDEDSAFRRLAEQGREAHGWWHPSYFERFDHPSRPARPP